MDPISLAAIFGPMVIKAGEAAINKWLSPDKVKPATVAEAVELMKAETERFAAINAAGGGNPSYPWVEAIIRLQRPFAVIAVLGAFLAMVGGLWAPSEEIQEAMTAFGQAVVFYLFADRGASFAMAKLRPTKPGK